MKKGVRFDGIENLNQNWLWALDLTEGKTYSCIMSRMGIYITDDVGATINIEHDNRIKYFTKL